MEAASGSQSEIMMDAIQNSLYCSKDFNKHSNILKMKMMKSVLQSVLIATIIALTSSCTRSISIKEPEQIGKKVFEILKNISIDSKEVFISKFISIDEIRELGTNEKVVKDEETRIQFTSISKEYWINMKESEYNMLKETALKSGVNLKNIEYLDFIYELKHESGVEVCKGELYFTFNDKMFRLKIDSLWNGKEYKLIKFFDLDQY